MKKLLLASTAVAAFAGSALAADLPTTYTKAPVMPAPVYNWTSFYVFGGAGGGLWAADSNAVLTDPGAEFPVGTAVTHDQRLGGSGVFGTVGAGYDWQFNGRWVAGIFADGQFGEIRGSLSDASGGSSEGREKLRTSYAAGARLGYLVAPNVLSYVNAGYSGSEWSGTNQTLISVTPFTPTVVETTTPSFHRDGFFVGGGVENNLDIFGINVPGLFMKTEYRSAFYNRASLPETFAPGNSLFGPNNLTATGLVGQSLTFKPWVQTISTSLVYRFNSGGPVGTDLSAPRAFTKAPVMPASAYNWTGFYISGGAGGGLWAADSDVVVSPSTAGDIGTPIGTVLTRNQRLGGSGVFGTVGAGYDWRFNGRWVAGIFADGQFGEIRGSLSDSQIHLEGREKLRTSYAAGARLGYLVAPNVLSYVNAGYSGSEWSGTNQTNIIVLPGFPTVVETTTPSFHRDGFFVGGGVENSLDIFGINVPGLFMKTEYRSAFYNRASLPETFAPGNTFFPGSVGLFGESITFKPWVQTISTSLVYRFNSPVVAKY